jgi:exosortase/archaeosortase family protein
MNDLYQDQIKRERFKEILKIFLFWGAFTGNLFLIFAIGYYLSSDYSFLSILSTIFLVPIIIIILNFVLIQYFSKESIISIKKKLVIWLYFTINHLFSFIIGITIPLMESISRNNYAIFMLPLLSILNYILLRRLKFYLKNNEEKIASLDKKDFSKKGEIKTPIIEFEGKNYTFSIYSLGLLALGAPLLALAIYFFFDWEISYWLHEIVVKQTTFLLNWFFEMGVSNSYVPVGKFHWNFNIAGRGSIYFETFCTGVQAICIFAGIILFTPHSKDPYTNRDIVWRKTKSLIISSAIFYIVNILRMVIQIYLYYIGYAWSDIHYSISAASSFIAAIIVLLMHKWIPEFIISLIWTYALLKKKIKKNKKK